MNAGGTNEILYADDIDAGDAGSRTKNGENAAMTKKNAGAATKRPATVKRTALRPTAAAHAVTFALATLAAGLAGTPAHAFKFENEWVKGSFDSTVSLGFIKRMQKPDRSIIGNDNGGNVPKELLD